MKKIISAAVCDARNVTEESLAGFDQIRISAAVLIVNDRSKELLNRHAVEISVANVIEIPDGEDISVQTINGKGEIGPDADGKGVFLMVNGKLLITEGAGEAVKSYYRIMVNGKVLMPESLKGQFSNLQINGGTVYYPDGATILKAGTEIDNLFITRAANTLYYSSGNLFFLDDEMDTEKLIGKGLRFAARKIVIAESLLEKLISQFDEEVEIIRVPDGTRLIDDDLELKPKTIKKYGSKLFVDGDVSIKDAEALGSLEYLYADGTVRVNKELEEAFDEIETVYDALKVIDPNLGVLSDHPILKVGKAVFDKYPSGVRIEDCAKVTLSEELSPEDIMNKLHISDCAVIVCTKEQEEAVNMVSEDVAVIRVAGQKSDGEEDEGGAGGMVDDILNGFFGKQKDAQVISAAEYKM